MINTLKQNLTLVIIIAICIALYLVEPVPIKTIPSFVDWPTVLALSGLAILTAAFRESGYLRLVLVKILDRDLSERALASILILLTCGLSCIFTNDVSLFIVIPLTMGLQDYISNDLTSLVVCEAIAANTGSALTPIGNPQNLFIWHQWGISFFQFVYEMFPLEMLLMGLLMAFLYFLFPSEQIKIHKGPETRRWATGLFWASCVLMLIFLIAMELRLTGLALLPIIFFYLVYDPQILKNSNWDLILIFVLLFILLHLLSNLPVVKSLLACEDLNCAQELFLTGIVTSQIMSNVPAAILLSKFTDDWLILCYAVNIGGNGLVQGSLANIIALQLAAPFIRQQKKLWIRFHLISVPFLFFSILIVWLTAPFYLSR